MLRTIIRNNKKLILLLVIIILGSCDSKRVFDEYKQVQGNAWDKDKPVQFQFSIKDTLTAKNLFINLRNNNDYAYSNLFVITEMKFPDGKKIIDTLEYDMADPSGKFLGEGFSDIKENKLFYKENIKFPIQGSYSLQIQQAMRNIGEVKGITSLKGITDIGFRIEKI